MDGQQLLNIISDDISNLVDFGLTKRTHQIRVKTKLDKASLRSSPDPRRKSSSSFGFGQGVDHVAAGYEELELFKGDNDVNRVFNDLLRRRCGLLTYIGTERRDDGNDVKTYRFPHLTFQEHFVAQHIALQLNAELGGTDSDRNVVFDRHVGKGDGSKIFDVWFREVMVFLAGALDRDGFEHLARFLTEHDDGSGAAQARVFQVLRDRGLDADADLRDEDASLRASVMHMCKSAVSVRLRRRCCTRRRSCATSP